MLQQPKCNDCGVIIDADEPPDAVVVCLSCMTEREKDNIMAETARETIKLGYDATNYITTASRSVGVIKAAQRPVIDHRRTEIAMMRSLMLRYPDQASAFVKEIVLTTAKG